MSYWVIKIRNIPFNFSVFVCSHRLVFVPSLVHSPPPPRVRNFCLPCYCATIMVLYLKGEPVTQVVWLVLHQAVSVVGAAPGSYSGWCCTRQLVWLVLHQAVSVVGAAPGSYSGWCCTIQLVWLVLHQTFGVVGAAPRS